MSRAQTLSEYTVTDDREHAEAMVTIAWILKRRPTPDQAISSQALADATGEDGPKATTVRDLIPAVVREHGIPIGSCPDGYYRIASTDELAAELDSRRAEIETKRENARALASAFYSEGQ